MSASRRLDPAPSETPAGAVEAQLHANVEALQAEVRALAGAVDHLRRALELAVAGHDDEERLTALLEEVRWTLGEIW